MKNVRPLKTAIAIALLATTVLNVNAAPAQIDQVTVNVAIKTDAQPSYSTYMTCFTKDLSGEANNNGFFKIEINGLYGCGPQKPLSPDMIKLINQPEFGVLVYKEGSFRKSFGITYSNSSVNANTQVFNLAITDIRGGQYSNY